MTPIRDVETFYLAEDYHQDYYRKSPLRYKLYRRGSGRDEFLQRVWGDDLAYAPKPPTKKAMAAKLSDAELRKLLTPLQYKVTQQGAGDLRGYRLRRAAVQFARQVQIRNRLAIVHEATDCRKRCRTHRLQTDPAENGSAFEAG